MNRTFHKALIKLCNLYEAVLTSSCSIAKPGAKIIETAVVNALLRAAQATSWKAAHSALREIADRLEGKAPQTVTVNDNRSERELLAFSLILLARRDGRASTHEQAVIESETEEQ